MTVRWSYLAGLWCIPVKKIYQEVQVRIHLHCVDLLCTYADALVYVVGLMLETLTDRVYKLAMASQGNCNYTLRYSSPKQQVHNQHWQETSEPEQGLGKIDGKRTTRTGTHNCAY